MPDTKAQAIIYKLLLPALSREIRHDILIGEEGDFLNIYFD